MCAAASWKRYDTPDSQLDAVTACQHAVMLACWHAVQPAQTGLSILEHLVKLKKI